MVTSSSSSFSSIGTATLVGYGLLNYRWVFSECFTEYLQSAVASGTSNPQHGGPVIRTFQLPPPGVPHTRTTRENYGREIAENFAESGDFHVTLGSFTCRKFTTWGRRLYFPSEGRRVEDFFARKIRRLRPGLNPRTRVSRPARLPLDHRSR